MKRWRTTLAACVAVLTACLATQSSRADHCELLWDLPCCIVPGTNIGVSNNVLTICNCFQDVATYDFFLKGGPAGTTFSPPGGVVTLAPGECIEIPIMVTCDPSATGPMGGGFVFQANVTNIATGAQFSCQGSVRGVENWKVTPVDPVVAVPVGTTVRTQLVVSNIGSSGKDGVSIDVMTMGGGTATARWQNPIVMPTGGQCALPLDIRFDGPPSARGATFDVFFDVIVSYDDDGDGVPEQNSSLKARVVGGPCIGDLDGDGVVGSADLAELIGRWGPCP